MEPKVRHRQPSYVEREKTLSMRRGTALRGALALALLTTLGCDQSEGGRSAADCSGETCDDPIAEANWWELEQLVDQLESDHQDYREAEADLGFHFSSFGTALDGNQYMAFVEAFWANHRSERERYQASAVALRNGIERSSTQEIADRAGLDAISGAGIRAYIAGLDALADTPEAQAGLVGLVDLRASMDEAEKPLGLFITDDEQAELVGAAIESMFAEAVLSADPTLRATPYFNPSLILDDTLESLQADGDPWNIQATRDELSYLWTIESAAQSGDFTIAVREWLEEKPRTPVEQSLAMISVTGSLLADDRVLGAEPLPDDVRDAMTSFQRFASIASHAHTRGLQPLVTKLGEHSRVWGRVAAPWVGKALGVMSSTLILGIDIYDLQNNPDVNIYDRLALLGSVASTGGTIVSAFGAPQVGIVLIAIGMPVRMLAGHLADAQRYKDSREELRGESRELLITIGLPTAIAHALASADPDTLHVLAGTAGIYGGLGVGLSPSEIQQVAANNAELLFDRGVFEAGRLDSLGIQDRALILAVLVDGGLLDRDDVVPTLRAMAQAYRDSDPLRENPTDDMRAVVYSQEVEAGLAHLVWSIGSYTFPHLHSGDPFEGLPDPCHTIAYGLGIEDSPSVGTCIVAETLYPNLDCAPLVVELPCNY